MKRKIVFLITILFFINVLFIMNTSFATEIILTKDEYNNTKIYNQIITSNQNENLENNVSSENIIVKSVSGNFDSNIEKNPELVNLKITKYDLENNRVTLTITDNNEVPYWWDSTFDIEIKKDNAWHEAERINPKTLLLLKKDYIRDENNQIDFIIHWINDYGILQSGIYRIVKETEKDMLFYSNEFEIK